MESNKKAFKIIVKKLSLNDFFYLIPDGIYYFRILIMFLRFSNIEIKTGYDNKKLLYSGKI